MVLLCTLLRGARLFESKRVALSLLVSAALQCEEEVRLQAVVPYLVTLLGDAAAGIRTLALRCLVRVMCSIDIIPPSDAKVCPGLWVSHAERPTLRIRAFFSGLLTTRH